MTMRPLRIPPEPPHIEPPAAPDDRLLIDVRELSRLTSLSVRTLRRMDSCGDLPGRVVVRRRVRFQLAAIRAWVAAGCPARG
jgi:predicted DNA-binding transcriptional regulator AlpA